MARVPQTAQLVEAATPSPLELISQPLYLPRDGEPKLNEASWKAGWESLDPDGLYLDSAGKGLDLAPWELPTKAGSHPHAASYAAMLSREKLFVPAPLDLIIEMGILPSWLQDAGNRSDALALISGRAGWRKALDELADTGENGSTIFRINALPEYYKTIPAVKRKLERESGAKPKDARPARKRNKATDLDYVWHHHRLRLRKVIELFALLEASLAWRFRHHESLGKLRSFTKNPNEEPQADFVLRYFRIEPVIHVIWPLPRPEEIGRMMDRETLVSEFTGRTGQSRGALYWLLRGMVGKAKTVRAAAALCNAYYGPDKMPTRAVTVSPGELTIIKRATNQDGLQQAPKDYRRVFEDLREFR